MSEFKVAIIIEPDTYEYGTTPNPLDSFLKTEAYRRDLEDRVQIKQLGQGIFTASIDDKHAVFDAIDWLRYQTPLSNGLRVKPFLIQPLDTEFKLWQRSFHSAPPCYSLDLS